MKAQPARVNYFFGRAYSDLWDVIRCVFDSWWERVKDNWEEVTDHFPDAWSGFFGFIKCLVTLEWGEAFGEAWDSIKASVQWIFFFFRTLTLLFVTLPLTLLFCAIHIVLLFSVMFLIYLTFSFFWLIDTLFRKIRQISYDCPYCQQKISMPFYECPACGQIHTALRPSKYGIFRRECDCGKKIPTTFLNGRQKLTSYCPFCERQLPSSGLVTSISIPVIGGPSAGKTCLVNMAIQRISEEADSLGLDFEYIANEEDEYSDNVRALSRGHLPAKTNDMRLCYYQFRLSPRKSRIQNQISLCDVAGEIFSEENTMGAQIGFHFASAFLMVIDPLSIRAYRREVEQTTDISHFGGSAKPIDEVISMLTVTLESMYSAKAGSMLNANLAVVFTKCDLPGLADKIGDPAIRAAVAASGGQTDRFAACNQLCEQFLVDYDEAGFVQNLHSRFRNVQFFTVSALGHNEDGSEFVPDHVEDPVLWLIEKGCGNINLKDKWAR